MRQKLTYILILQVLWLIRAMVGTGVSGADKLCFALLKQLPGNLQYFCLLLIMLMNGVLCYDRVSYLKYSHVIAF